MLEVSYKREMKHNYMIIGSPAGEAGGYECRMLAGNSIEGLLEFRIRYREEKKDFYYEISSKQPLKRLLEQRTVTGNEIRRLLLGIAATLNKVEEFLLHEEQILLDPEYIYVEPDQFFVYLCMVPGFTGDFPAAFTALLQYLLEKVDHKDKDGVVLAYHIYHESLKENYGMGDLLKYLSKEEGPIFDKREPENRVKDRTRPEESWRGKAEAANWPDKDGAEENWSEKTGAEKNWSGKTGTEKNWNGKIGAEKSRTGNRMKGEGPEQKVTDRKYHAGTVKKQDGRKRGTEPKKKKRTGHGNGFKTELKISRAGNLMNRLGSLSAAVLAAAAALGILWFLAGEEALYEYGAFLGAAVFGLFCLKDIIVKKPARELSLETAGYERRKTRSQDMDTDTPGRQKIPKPDTWRIEFDDAGDGGAEAAFSHSEAVKEEREPEEDSVATTLLADFGIKGGTAVLESLNRERENIEIAYVPFIIGKHAEMTDYCLKQPTVSRLHLRIDKKEGVYIATDLNSTNGTTVEGYGLQANETVSIKNGDVIYLAELGFRFIEREE